MSEFTEHITHLVQMNLDNDYDLYIRSREIAFQDCDYKTDRDTALKEFVRGEIDWPDDTMGGDVINAALGWVNWSEIVDDILEEEYDEEIF